MKRDPYDHDGEHDASVLALAALVVVVIWVCILGLCCSGCDRAPRYTVAGVTEVIEQRPEVIYYGEQPGPWASVWGHGPVNVVCNLTAYRHPLTVGQMTPRMTAGGTWLGAFAHTPMPGDTLRGVLLPGCPLVDSTGATRGGFVLACVLPDTLEGYAWAIIPPGAYGPDSIVTWMRVVRIP